jgi:sarcosine oxidase
LRQAEVLAVRPVSGPGVEVLTPQGSHGHDAAVLCAGADTVRLAAQLGLSLPVEHALHLRATFDVRGAAPDRAACLQDATGQHGETVYGSPWPSRERFAVGSSGDSGEVRGAQLDRFGELRTRLCAYVRAALPGLDPAPVGDVTCRVTRLPWGGDGVAAWQIGAVTAVAGNNMFKLAPVLGELLADAVCGAGVPAILRPETQLGRPGG